jgi:hypothetical protein
MFEIRGLRVTEDGLRFYIKPEDGKALPAIMKWLKQVFAQRYNRAQGREGHIWGDRYGSRILEGEPPLLGEPPLERDSRVGVSPCYKELPPHLTYPPLFPLLCVPSTG